MPVKSDRFSKRSRKGGRKANKMRPSVKKIVASARRAEFGTKVRSVVTRMAEKKTANYATSFFFGATNATSFYTTQIQYATGITTALNIGQGTGQGDRIGDKIRVQKLKLDMAFWPTPYNVSTNPTPEPQYIRVWVFSQKNSNAPITSLATFFQNGNASSAPTGTLLDLLKKINQDQYTYLTHREFKLGYAAFVGAPGGVVGSGYFSNNDFEMVHKESIDLTPLVPKIWTFNDTGNTCTSKAVYVMYEAMSCDGQTSAAADLPVGCYASYSLKFTDL